MRRERHGAGGVPGAGLSSLFGLHRCGKHTDDNGDHSEALSKDASSHQQLGLSGFPLVEGTEPVHESSCCSQATWNNRQRGQAMRGCCQTTAPHNWRKSSSFSSCGQLLSPLSRSFQTRRELPCVTQLV